jgi:hypothetical protein
MRTRLARVPAASLVALVLALIGPVVLGAAPPAHAYTIGWNTVATPSESSSWGTGYGPGWVALTFDTGTPGTSEASSWRRLWRLRPTS